MAPGGKIYLPALKGFMGVNYYYIALMTLKQVAERIHIGDEIHQSRGLSDMVQRALKKGREAEIANYLLTVQERFFGAMVVGVYGGRPDWKPFPLASRHDSVDISSLRLDTINSFGFLELSGEEKLFPLDGQHRLVGVRRALRDESAGDLAEEEMTVIFLAHDKDSKAGRERSRRLFTVLNKRAKPVNKNEIIALDEDDAMAIVTRWLVEDYAPLAGERVRYSASATMPAGQPAITTIGALYDSLGFLFVAASGLKRRLLEDSRPSDSALNYLTYCAKAFFDEFAIRSPAFAEFVASDQFDRVAAANRHADGGNILFRPLGLKIFAQIVANLLTDWTPPDFNVSGAALAGAKRSAGHAIQRAVQTAAKLPMELAASPYKDILWNSDTRRIQAARASLTRDLLLDQLGRIANREKLRQSYAQALGREGEHVLLPADNANQP